MNQRPQYEQSIRNSYIKDLVDKINRNGALSVTLTNEEINLPERASWKVSQAITMKQTQLRKYFSMINDVKNCSSLQLKKQKLMAILPLIAYAAGRDLCSNDFFYLLKACISNATLKEEKDITAFIDFITAIVAYTKFLGKGDK